MTDKINDGGPAFPGVEKTEYPSCAVETPYPGMSLRDYFAAEALAALIVAHGPASAGGWPTYAERTAYLIADAMLAAREVKHD